LGGVTVKLSGDAVDRTITNADGVFRFTNVELDGFYSVTPARANFRFSPSQRSFALLGDRTDAVFTALPLAEIANPLDDEGFFVRQQYLDFLNREPDHGGWLYWTDEIGSCGLDAACVRSRRIAVSAAFFASEEFQQTGSFVYRLYRAALGRQLSYNEFLDGRSRIVEGANREASQINFARDFVQQPEFVARYSPSLTSEQFVDAVIANMQTGSGIDLSGSRSSLLAIYESGIDLNDSRAAVMREAIDDAQFIQAEFNRTFVLMQYFGYLRRDPDQGGYDFWLDILNNREPNNYRGMVCAFVTSAEYQQRFSTAVTRGNSECGQ
jgi:hypothetical protein